ncbi:MAG: DUF1566 domain-containing protein [Bacteroidales bacterium]|nr:DUF1566 domain-containing protein [Bacteroidales bacterium]
MKRIFLLTCLFVAACTSTPRSEAPEAVDLGLSVKWAPFNIGATAPEEFGNMYAWGKTDPSDGAAFKEGYRSKYPDGSVLDSKDDVAAAEWGGGWRMPTAGEFRELVEKCEWTWTLGEPNGFVVKGPNGNSIFLPAAGFQLEDILAIRGTGGFYWTSTAAEDDETRAMLFQYRRLYGTDGPGLCKGLRYEGYSVRAVLDDRPEGWAPDLYWADGYDGPLGFHTGFNAAGKTRMMLAGKPLYCFGINCFDLFTGCMDGGFIPERIEKAVEVIAEQKMPVVRLSLSPFYPFWMHYYTETPDRYFECMELLFNLCDEKHILLIPTLFWNFSCFNELCGEPLSAWGDPSSRTYAFMLKYTKDIMTRFAGHKCIAAWEFSNEFNLHVDLGHEGNPMITAAELGTACKGFAGCVREYDPTGRMIMSGHGLTRNAQYHLYTGPSWDVDSFDESVRIIGILTPSPMEGFSEHYYEDKRIYSDLGEMDFMERTAASKATAEALDKVFYVGEYTGPGCTTEISSSMKAQTKAFYDNAIQLSLVWNFSNMGNIEYSFTADSEGGLKAFELIREYNRRYAAGEVRD